MRQLTALDQQFLALEDSRRYGPAGALEELGSGVRPAEQENVAGARENA